MNIMNRPWKMGTLEIKNSLVRSATDEGLSTEKGAPTQRLINTLVELAKGGAGLIIAGTAYISHEGRWGNTGTGMDKNCLIKPLSQLCKAVQKADGIIAAQLLHCGSTVNPAILPEKKSLLGPSAMIDPVIGHPVLELSRDHILKIVDDYAKAALRAKQAGFKAVQIHAAHGYLINQFLSTSRNWRKDQYGGSLKKRSLFLYQVYEAIRGAVGKEFPVFIKMSAYDGFPGGVMPQDAIQVASALDAMGIDAIEVSAGTPEGAKKGGWDHIIPAPFKEGSLLKYALQIKEKVNCPVISVEGWRDPLKIVQTLEKIDAVSMCRPFIREPDLANRWLGGDLSPALCISCNKCLDLTLKSGLGCIFHKRKKDGHS
ncbi:MAG: NADH:flavin oxidoreductase [Deltaproteobacteria bacterium]|uniref:NADH:flavin oxidoreductase n=1 Tax=Desulfobacula sp. TaxID=2593537 RepID=UPI0019B75701|nr:NADH:flavin oxidoreductase [Candidatus Desulfobacula maris]MBL6992965.1 NADH:flavin oxidoreductase [Desulfobacula sp.]